MLQTLRLEIVAPLTAPILLEPLSGVEVVAVRGLSARRPWRNCVRKPGLPSLPSSILLPRPGVSFWLRMLRPVMVRQSASTPMSSSILSAKPWPEALMTQPSG